MAGGGSEEIEVIGEVVGERVEAGSEPLWPYEE